MAKYENGEYTRMAGILKGQFRKRLGHEGVVLTDLDDVWFQTSVVYLARMLEVGEIYAPLVGKSAEDVRADLRDAIVVRRESMHVNPLIMPTSVADLHRRYGIDDGEVLARSLEVILSIFDDEIPLHKDAEHALYVLRGVNGVGVAAWTHAAPDWTDRKLAVHPDLLGVFSSGVFPVDVDKPKECISVIESLGKRPDEVMIIGDSLRSDIWSAVEAGVPRENVVWVKSDFVEANVGDVPDGIQTASSLWDAVRQVGGF